MRAFYINMTAGATTVTNPVIVSTTVLNVKREGIGHNQVSGSPGVRDFVYDILTGKFTFLNPSAGETVYVLCL